MRERGLKFLIALILTSFLSRSREGAWIEIAPSISDNGVGAGVAPVRERGLKSA